MGNNHKPEPVLRGILGCLLLLLVGRGAGAAGRPVVVHHNNPVRQRRPLLLQIDLDGDGRQERLLQTSRPQSGTAPEFHILRAGSRRPLCRIRPGGRYCAAITVLNLDGKGAKEVLFESVDPAGKQRFFVLVQGRGRSWKRVEPDRKPLTRQARLFLHPARGSYPGEIRLIGAIAARHTIFQYEPEDGIQPRYWVQQVFRFQDGRLRFLEQEILKTPFHILERYLSALRKGQFFQAYRHYYPTRTYRIFRSRMRHLLYHDGVSVLSGSLTLKNWNLEAYKKKRTRGWITFLARFPGRHGKKKILYQAFMKNVYGDWKITLLRKARIYP